MIKLTASQVHSVLASAVAEIGVTEVPPGSNAGPRVEEYLATVHLPKGNPWCAGFVAWCGVQVMGSAWPVPRVGGCATLGDWAKKVGWRMLNPKLGDVFLLHFPKLGRFAHTGFITDVPDASGKWGTIEGNTSGGGSREGWGVFRQRRAFGANDRFIRIGAP